MRVTILCATVAFVACGPRQDVVEADLAVVGVHVIPMTGDSLLRSRTVLVRDGHVVRIAEEGTVIPSGAARIVQGGGRFLMPGLVDAHVHLRAVGALDLFLSHGFTTLRNMHGGLGDPLTWERQIHEGRLRGPTLINASPILRWDTPSLTLPGPDPIDSFERVRAAVQAASDSGYASIKVLEFPRDAFDTLMAAARGVGLPVTGHPPITDTGDPDQDMTLSEVLGSGMTVIEHLDELIYDGIDPQHRDSVSAQALADEVAASGVAVTTITDVTRLIEKGLRLDTAFVTPELRATALTYGGPTEVEFLYRLPEIWQRQGLAPIQPDYLSLVVRLLHRAGVPLMVGTDAHSSLQVGGMSAIEDMRFLVASGLSTHDALAAMTSVPARVLGYQGIWGTVAEGVRADLLLLDGNPLDDPSVLVSGIEGVALRGEWIEPSELAAMRARAESKVLFCRAPRCE